MRRLSTCLLALVTLGCAGLLQAEGDQAGECDNDADEDQDGLFDCDDEGCANSDTCKAEAYQLDDSTRLSELTQEDCALLCKEQGEKRGYTCENDGNPYTLTYGYDDIEDCDDIECDDDFSDCSATVGEFRDCQDRMEDVHQADACATEEPEACDVIEDCDPTPVSCPLLEGEWVFVMEWYASTCSDDELLDFTLVVECTHGAQNDFEIRVDIYDEHPIPCNSYDPGEFSCVLEEPYSVELYGDYNAPRDEVENVTLQFSDGCEAEGEAHGYHI